MADPPTTPGVFVLESGRYFAKIAVCPKNQQIRKA